MEVSPTSDTASLQEALKTIAALSGIRLNPAAISAKDLRIKIASSNEDKAEIRISYGRGHSLSLVRFNNPQLKEKWFYRYRPGTESQWSRIEPECRTEAERVFSLMSEMIKTGQFHW